MKACVLHAIGDLRLEDVPAPVPGEGEVLIRVGACGVCGSDLPRVFVKGTYRFPTVPGHEFAGTIADVGAGVDSSLVGRLAAVFPLLPCRSCAMCREGQFALCSDYGYLGSRSNGAFAEWVCAPVWNLVLAPSGVSIEEAAMTEPAAVALHALHQGELNSGDKVAVIGAGPIGLLCALWARALGARDIVVTDVDGAKRKFAQEIGFSSRESPGDHDFDLVVEASGSANGCAAAIMATAPRGRLVLMGNPGGDMMLPQDVYWTILRREMRLVGTWNSQFASSAADEWHTVLDAMATKCLDVTPLISHRIGLGDLPKMLMGMRDRTVATHKVLVVNPL